jgi:hypothetical protein
MKFVHFFLSLTLSVLFLYVLDNRFENVPLLQDQKDLQKIQKERQKIIEQQMVEEAQKELERERNDRIEQLGERQLTATDALSEEISGGFNYNWVVNNTAIKLAFEGLLEILSKNI